MTSRTFGDVIDLWPTAKDFADDIGAPYGSVRAWKSRGSIPSHWWCDIVDKSKGKIGYEELAYMAAKLYGHR